MSHLIGCSLFFVVLLSVRGQMRFSGKNSRGSAQWFIWTKRLFMSIRKIYPMITQCCSPKKLLSAAGNVWGLLTATQKRQPGIFIINWYHAPTRLQRFLYSPSPSHSINQNALALVFGLFIYLYTQSHVVVLFFAARHSHPRYANINNDTSAVCIIIVVVIVNAVEWLPNRRGVGLLLHIWPVCLCLKPPTAGCVNNSHKHRIQSQTFVAILLLS